MRFDMKRPCSECPFRPGSSTNQTLSPKRIEEIKRYVHEEHKTFACHKSLDLPKIDQQHCAGALIHLEKSGDKNDMVQLAGRLGIYDKLNLDMNTKIID